MRGSGGRGEWTVSPRHSNAILIGDHEWQEWGALLPDGLLKAPALPARFESEPERESATRRTDQ